MNNHDRGQAKFFDFAVEILLLVFIFIVPTVYDRTIGIVFSGTKVPVLRMLMLAILSIWAVKILIYREHKFVRTLLDWPVASYMLAVTVATLTSVHVLVSFMGFYGRYEGLSTLYIYGLLYFVTVNFIKTKEQIRRIFVSVICAATLMSLYGIIQRMGIDPYAWGGVITWQRVIGTIGQPNFLAAYVIMAFFLGLSMLIMDKEKPKAVQESRPSKHSKMKSPASGDPVSFMADNLMLILPFLGFLLAYLIMIYRIDTNFFPLLVLSWTVITSLAIVFVFLSKDLEPIFVDVLLLICLPVIYTCIFFTQSRGGFLALVGAGSIFVLLVNRDSLIKNWWKLLILAMTILIITAATSLNPKYSPFQRFSEEITTEEGNQEEIKVVEERATGIELKGAAGSRIETWKSGYKNVADHPIFGIGPEVLKMVFPRYETDLFRFKEAFHVKQDRNHNEVFDVSVTKGMVTLFIYTWLVFMFFKVSLDKVKSPIGNDVKIYIAGIVSAAASYFFQNQFSFGVVAITTLLWIMFGLVSLPDVSEDEDVLKLPPFKGLSVSEVPWLYVALVFAAFLFLSYISCIQYRADYWFKAGKNYVDRSMFPEALDMFKKSLDISPYEGGTLTYYGITFLNAAQNSPDKMKLYDRSIAVLKEGTLVDPYNADNFYILGKTYLTLQTMGVPGALERSLDYTNKAIAIDPYYAEAYHNRGLVYEMEGQLDRAAAEYKRAFMINPSLTMSMQRLGIVYSTMGHPEKIVETFNEALAKYPNETGLLENLGIAYQVMNKNSDAIGIYEKIISLDSKNVRAMINIGSICIKINDLKRAEDELNRAFTLDPSNVDIHNNLGLIYLREGRRERAIEEFNQVLIVDPNNQYAKKMLAPLGIK